MKPGLIPRIALIGAILLPLAAAQAETYNFGVTRKSKDLYKVEGKEIMIHTQDCEVDGYTEKATVKSEKSGIDITFHDTKQKCTVDGVFDATNRPKNGKYGVTITRVENDWFEVTGSKLFLKSEPRCLRIAIKEPATLEVSGEVGGYLIFPSGKKCKVEGIYSRASL